MIGSRSCGETSALTSGMTGQNILNERLVTRTKKRVQLRGEDFKQIGERIGVWRFQVPCGGRSLPQHPEHRVNRT
jgi:hypothetical protein